ncbi:uncharacterized protein LOC115453808 isoform X3 [Manduca sexta]|uniref:uncharacterized protein LOC115453808 isoform X3 n=1 Tax=Manduca sexta TaxID=7130 RepID=UPI00188EF70C|nr:uncharacterized protein LOC115453808 isoform X3 [Manduca sexta]
MSDKSFGDQTNRNIVKNPLLSSAVTGLSLEDLTNKAILLPVTPSQGLITRPDPKNTLAHQTAHDHNVNPKHEQPKPKDDDFDVNEYFARLQGTRYVSAPLNSQIETLTTENFEEVNLETAEPEREQQSLTADIAQNFSQLPTVLPHVASAVFSSFSNMLSLKSREVTPDEREKEVPQVVQDVPAPLKEPPIGGGGNFRISAKKKYAQIPGLSSGGQQTGVNPIQPPTMPDNTQKGSESHINFFTEATQNIYPNIGYGNANVGSNFGNQNVFSPNVGQIEVNTNVKDGFNAKESGLNVKDEFNVAQVNLNFAEPKEIGANMFAQKDGNPLPPSQYPVQGSTPVIPPPPMFSNRRDGQSAGKSVLPPSVARRISANHPIMKPQVSATTVIDNIFVPTFDQTNVQTSASQALPPMIQESSKPPIFVPTFPASSENVPIMPMPIGQSNVSSQAPKPPIGPSFAQTLDSNIHTSESNTSQPELSAVPMFTPTSSFAKDFGPPLSGISANVSQASKPPIGSTFPPTLQSTISAPESKTPRPELSSVPMFALTSSFEDAPPISSSTGPSIFTPTLPTNTFSSASTATGPSIFTPSLPPKTTSESTSASEQIPMFAANISGATGSSIFSPTLPPAPVSTVASQPEVPMYSNATIFDPTKAAQPSANIGPSHQPAPPTFFNPQHKPQMTQENTPETKPLIEPPKSTGISNYRMTKKRPQYYSGPIEGVGAISNNVKPVIPPVDAGAFQGALLAPEPTRPFPVQALETESATPFDISKPFTQPEYNTAFDLSRQTTELYDQQPEKQETKTFGLIGSLKSKLSSIDINKIQNTVTTFFDPAYNEPKVEGHSARETTPSEQNTYQSFGQSNFEIFVPSVDQTNQTYNYQNTSYYNQQYYQQNTYNYYDQGQTNPAASYYQNPNYQTQTNTGPQASASYTQPIDTNADYGQPIVKTDANIQSAELESHKADVKEISSQILKPIETTHSDKIDDISKTEVVQEQVVAASDSNIPVDIQKPVHDLTSVIDFSAKSFFDSPMTETLKEETKSIDLLYATGDKAEKDTRNKDIKSKMDFTFNDLNDRGEDKIFDEVLSSIIGEESPIGSKPHAKAEGSIKPIETKPFFPELVEPYRPMTFISPPEVKKEIFPSASIIKPGPDIQIRETNLLESLTTDAIPIVAVSSVPLFGLSTIIADKSKEHAKSDLKPASLFEVPKDTFFDKNASISFFEHIQPPKKNPEVQSLDQTSANLAQHSAEMQYLYDNSKEEKIKSVFEEKVPSAPELLEEGVSELSICETCREFNKPEDKETEDLTTQLIENITSRIQLSNPVEAPLTEGDSVENRTEFDSTQLAEIKHITEETIDTINVQSATELLDDEDKEMNPRNYGWSDPDSYPTKALSDHDYSFKLDPNSIGFFGNNSLFFDNVPNNASDEIKAEFKNSHEDMLTRQVSVPSAPPAEDDTKSDETGGLDVHSIEQDAKKDFPIYEEFVIEPSETDDDKIEYKEREKSEDPIPEIDSFTNRVERFKKMEEHVEPEEIFDKKCLFDIKPKNSPAISIASYFDTGNYAAETHYRNSLNSPSTNFHFSPANIPMRIPPGFEEEYHRRMSGISVQDKMELERLKLDIHYIPETSTQTPHTATATYVSSQSEDTEVGFDIKSNLVSLVEEDSNTPTPTEVTEPDESINQPVIKEENAALPDPINFFSSEQSDDAPETFNRLASYFSSPKENKSFFDSNQNKANINTTKPHKSFFELSQGQNHYIDRNIPDDRRAILDVMEDLTSVQNIVVTKEQIVRTVNYFTVEYDKVTFDEIKTQKDIDDNFTSVVDCEFCFKNTLNNLIDGKYNVRQLMNDSTERKRDSETMENNNESRKSVTLNLESYELHDDAKDGVTVVHENRSSSDYSPVKYHWFYSVDVEDKSIWRGFSITDSRALEEAYNSTDLNEDTVVATDGGRYDVNVMKRLRTAVYWTEKSTDVSRCSWFYKGPTDARYVPYSEEVAKKLEEEYHHGMTTGEWHRRLLLPNNELVVMHGPSVMVHFLNSGAADAFSAPPSTSRPRVVRRGHDESEIEDTEPSSIDHLLLLCHGVGSACDMRFRSVEEVVDDFRATSLQLVQSHYKNSYDNGTVSRVEVLPISWHSTLHSGETGVDRRLAQITLDSMPRLRNFTNDTVLDVLFYTSPVYSQTIINTVCSELNRIYNLFVKRNPNFTGRVSLGGHSLGSVILYDLLCHQTPEPQNGSLPAKKLVNGPTGTSQLSIKYPTLVFRPAAMYALGSPIAMFECIRGVESLGTEFALPTCDNFFNIFHPYDPIAYRIEPLINPRMRDVKPSLIPHHKGRKRMHLELKDTMSRVGADLKQKLIESLRTTWNKWMSQPPTDGQLEKVVEEEMEKEQLCDESKEEFEKQLASSGMSGRLNGGRRVDYVLQEAPLELINEYLFAMRSHVGYWESEDTMLLMLREIYDALGVQPDGTLPQQGMTVQRTKNARDETIIIDHPSTSRGGT